MIKLTLSVERNILLPAIFDLFYVVLGRDDVRLFGWFLCRPAAVDTDGSVWLSEDGYFDVSV
jgi:hypothetical protein